MGETLAGVFEPVLNRKDPGRNKRNPNMRAMNLGDEVPSMSIRTSVKSRWRLLLALTLALCMEMAAAETTAIITRSVNVRSAPHTSLPTVTWLLQGTRVTVIGCMPNWHWCDVVSGRHRGWVYTRYLSVPFEGRTVTILDGGPNLGLPAIDFSLGPYWDEHYQSQVWFAQKPSWQARWDRRRAPPKWREPSSSR
jgi:uncharacterized protein YraI